MFRHLRLLPALLVFWSVTVAPDSPRTNAPSPLTTEMAAVEKIRGLKFTHDVAVKTMERGQTPERGRAEMQWQVPYPVSDYITVLRALQLVDGRTSDLPDKF